MFNFNRFHKPQLIPFIVMAAAFLLLVWLGIWQLERLQWKNTLIAQIKTAQAAAPLTQLPENGRLSTQAYRSVILEGNFLCGGVFYRPTGKEGYGAGFFALRPFIPEDGALVLVNTGFVKKGPAQEAYIAPDQANCEGDQHAVIHGVLRPPIQKRMFTPARTGAQSSLWFYEDITAMGQQLGLPLLPMIVEQTGKAAPNQFPMPSTGEIRITNDHLGYAVTWFLLAIISVGMFAAYHRKPQDNA